MNSVSGTSRRPFPAWLPAALLTLLAIWLRWRALPGTWGSDALTYFELAHGDASASSDPRADRWLAVALVRGALRLADWSPAAASVPGVALSAAVVPALWFGLRRSLGDALALLPCVLWTFLGLSFEEGLEISSDVMTALPVAVAAGALAAASRRSDGRTLPLLAAGAALGVGATLKETVIFTALGFCAGALCLGTGRRRLVDAATLAAAALAVFGAGMLVADPHRIEQASAHMTWDSQFLLADGDALLRRMTVAMPAALLTTTQAWGLLFVVALPLLARLPFRALRGDPLAAAAIVAFLAFQLLPISFGRWSMLPAERPRYLLAWIPVALAALALALREQPASRAERWTSLLAAAAGFAFARSSALAMVVVPVGLAVTAWPSLPVQIAERGGERTRLGLAAGVLLAATVSWSHVASSPAAEDWILAAAAGVLATTPWLVGRDRATPVPYFACAAGLVLAIATTSARFVPDPSWDAWAHLPSSGRVFAETLVGRRLRAAAVSAHADASRVVLLDADARPPDGLRPDDRILAQRSGPLTGGLRLADWCRLPGSGLAETPSGLGETAIFAPAPR